MFCIDSACLRAIAFILLLSLPSASCITSSSHKDFWGKVQPLREDIMRYVSGPEPESLDPQKSTSQPDARIHMALFDGLVEFHPKTLEPIPAIAERWENNSHNTEFVFYLRKNARFSNGDAITAKDVVYSFRRGFDPMTAARGANIGYYIKYAQAFNGERVFVKTKGKEEFLLAKDFVQDASAALQKPAAENATVAETKRIREPEKKDDLPDTAFHHYITSPVRLTLSGKAEERQKEINSNPKLLAAAEEIEFIPIKADDIGVEAIDDYTFRITLVQPAPYFLGMLANQFFRVVPKKAIERYGDSWTQPANIITSGAFTLKKWIPYSLIHVVKDPLYWDASKVRLNEIYFYPMDDETAIFYMYTAGEIEAMQNHSVLPVWMDKIRQMKDWMNAPEAAVSYYQINCQKPPMTDIRVRKAFNMAINRENLVAARGYNSTPAYGIVPPIFDKYPQSQSETFDVDGAKRLLAEAGYKDGSGKFDPSKFPVDRVEITFNPVEINKLTAEFVQAQWKQNLELNITLKSMEFKTFIQFRNAKEYKGFARGLYGADYMDPFTFLSIFRIDGGDNATGWTNSEYSALLDKANVTADTQERYKLLSEAESILMKEQPIIPLVYDATNFMKKPYVKGMYPNPQTLHAWKFVYIERDPAKWDYGVPDMTKKQGE